MVIQIVNVVDHFKRQRIELITLLNFVRDYISKMTTDGADIEIAIKHDVARGLAISLFRFDLGSL